MVPVMMSNRLLKRRDRGQSLVEFVLVLPILLVIVFGIIEFANAWRTSQIITNTAREVARMSVPFGSGMTQTTATDSVKARLSDAGLNGTKATVSFPQWCTNGGGNYCTGEPSAVRIQYPYSFQFFGPVMNLMCGSGCGSRYGTITLSSTATMRNE
jgi:Flp pilus assembly protein TadG